jgi:hypothetical protein
LQLNFLLRVKIHVNYAERQAQLPRSGDERLLNACSAAKAWEQK